MANNSLVFLLSYYEAIRPLEDEQRLIMYDAMLDYAFREQEPELRPPLSSLWALLRPNLDSSIRRYAVSCANGAKGGRPRKGANKTQSKPNGNPTETQSKPNGNPTETQSKPRRNQDKDKDKDKDWEKDKDSEQSPTEIVPAPGGARKQKARGRYGWVKLSDDKWQQLTAELGADELARCVACVDERAQGNGNKYGWKDWAAVVRRCHAEGWGLPRGKLPPPPPPTNSAASAERLADDMAWLAEFAEANLGVDGGG